ncbi:hypothetical protein [Halocatena marina]|uniref:hypothetical protein n=1 Tax=Halocatena marina TaxID=2934937 RepID=UPI00200C3D57|nr:hypothetical protein [Halocatena marina]
MGRDPVAFIEWHADRIGLINVRDIITATRAPVEVGIGDVDLKAIESAVSDAECPWVIYEYDSTDDPLE